MDSNITRGETPKYTNHTRNIKRENRRKEVLLLYNVVQECLLYLGFFQDLRTCTGKLSHSITTASCSSLQKHLHFHPPSKRSEASRWSRETLPVSDQRLEDTHPRPLQRASPARDSCRERFAPTKATQGKASRDVLERKNDNASSAKHARRLAEKSPPSCPYESPNTPTGNAGLAAGRILQGDQLRVALANPPEEIGSTREHEKQAYRGRNQPTPTTSGAQKSISRLKRANRGGETRVLDSRNKYQRHYPPTMQWRRVRRHRIEFLHAQEGPTAAVTRTISILDLGSANESVGLQDHDQHGLYATTAVAQAAKGRLRYERTASCVTPNSSSRVQTVA